MPPADESHLSVLALGALSVDFLRTHLSLLSQARQPQQQTQEATSPAAVTTRLRSRFGPLQTARRLPGGQSAPEAGSRRDRLPREGDARLTTLHCALQCRTFVESSRRDVV